VDTVLAALGLGNPLEPQPRTLASIGVSTSSSWRARATDICSGVLLTAECWPSLRVRMAIHCGQAEQRRDDYFGPTLNRVARLLSIAHGGQILLSGRAAALVAADVAADVTLADLGERRLKDLPGHERVLQVCAAGLARQFPPLRSAPPAAVAAGAGRAGPVVRRVATGPRHAHTRQRRRALAFARRGGAHGPDASS